MAAEPDVHEDVARELGEAALVGEHVAHGHAGRRVGELIRNPGITPRSGRPTAPRRRPTSPATTVEPTGLDTDASWKTVSGVTAAPSPTGACRIP